MLADATIREFVKDDRLRIHSQKLESLVSNVDENLQPNSIEVPTAKILDADGQSPPTDQKGWILEPGKEYSVVPDFSFSQGENQPELWVPAHTLLSDYGIIRPLPAFVEFKSRKLLLAKSGRRLISNDPFKIFYPFPNILGHSNRFYAEETDPSITESNIVVRALFDRSGLIFDDNEHFYVEDSLRLVITPFPRSGIQRRGVSLSFDPKYFDSGDELTTDPAVIGAKVECQFRTHVPFSYPLYHVVFDTNLGQMSYYSQLAREFERIKITETPHTAYTRFGVLLTPDVESLRRARKTQRTMPLGETVDMDDFFEPITLNELSQDDVFLVSSGERLTLDNQTIGFAAGFATLALKTTDRENYREGEPDIIPFGVDLNSHFHLFRLGGPPAKSSIDAICAGQTTGIIDSGFKNATITTMRKGSDPLWKHAFPLFKEGKLPVIYIGFEGVDRPVAIGYGNAGSTYQGKGIAV